MMINKKTPIKVSFLFQDKWLYLSHKSTQNPLFIRLKPFSKNPFRYKSTPKISHRIEKNGWCSERTGAILMGKPDFA
jgi:hypothetical protein